MTGVKYDDKKPRWSLLPTELLWGVVGVLEHGARKYTPNNWMHVPNGVERYSDAAARHLAAIERGELNDPDSGLPHAYHYLCSAIFVAWKVLNRPEELKAWRERGSVVIPVPAPKSDPGGYAEDSAQDAAFMNTMKAVAARVADAPAYTAVAVANTERHEHIFELTDSGIAAGRKWVCKCGDYVTHENGTHKYVRAWISGRVQQTYATYYDAQRGR